MATALNNYDNNRYTTAWHGILEERGIAVTDADLDAARQLEHVITSYNRPQPLVVASLPTGWGKSTFIQALTADYDRPYLVVLPRKSSVAKLQAALGDHAFALKGRQDFGENGEGEYYNQFNKGREYPVLICTASMFSFSARNGRYKRYLRDQVVNKMSRSRAILMDEAPELLSTYSITETELQNVLRDMTQAIRLSKQKPVIKRLMRENLDTLGRLVAVLAEVGGDKDYFSEPLAPIKDGYLLDEEVIELCMGMLGVERSETLLGAAYIACNGGHITMNRRKNGLEPVISATQVLVDQVPLDTPVTILDASSHIDPRFDLLRSRAHFIEVNNDDFSNVTLKYVTGATFSATYYSKPENRDKLRAFVQNEVLTGGNGPVLVAVHKAIVPEMQKLLAEEIATGHVVLKNLDASASGSNDWAEIDRMIIAGKLQLSSGVQIAMAGKLIEDVTTTAFKTNITGMTFADPQINELGDRLQVASMVQELGRLRAGRKSQTVEFYLLGTNDRVLELLKQSLPGVNMVKHVPTATNFRTRTSKITDELGKFLAASTAKELKLSDVQKILGFKHRSFVDFKSRPDTPMFFREYGYELNATGRKLIKIEKG